MTKTPKLLAPAAASAGGKISKRKFYSNPESSVYYSHRDGVLFIYSFQEIFVTNTTSRLLLI